MSALIPNVWIPGLPKGQPRARAFARNGHARMYDPGTAEAWKQSVACAVGPHITNQPPLAGPVYMRVLFVFPRPKSHSNRHGVKDGAPSYHTGKPDVDNAVKAVMDALTALNVWFDDAQVCRLDATKAYGIVPGAYLTVGVVE